jgi:putative PIN family toxin of toxin-antitoxin system
MLRIVLDTNQFVSSVLVRHGLPAQVLDAWQQRQFILIVSPAIMAEIRSTLNYPRIRLKYPITEGDVEGLVALLTHDAVVVPGAVNLSGVIPDDPDDERVLACAVEGGADLIVSGDRHLRELGEYQGIPIISARELLERLASNP